MLLGKRCSDDFCSSGYECHQGHFLAYCCALAKGVIESLWCRNEAFVLIDPDIVALVDMTPEMEEALNAKMKSTCPDQCYCMLESEVNNVVPLRRK